MNARTTAALLLVALTALACASDGAPTKPRSSSSKKIARAPVELRVPPPPSVDHMTFSEVLDGLRALEQSAAPDEQRALTYRALNVRGRMLAFPPFDFLVYVESRAALRAFALKAAITEAWKEQEDRLQRLGLSRRRPLPATWPPFTPDDPLAPGNLALSAGAMAVIYEDDAAVEETLQRQGFRDVKIIKSLVTSARAAVARRDDATLLVFCGTAGPFDVLADAELLRDEATPYGGGEVHQGFARQLQSVWPEVKAEVATARLEDPRRPVVVTGHSLGGALAVLAYARGREEGLWRASATSSQGAAPVAFVHTYGQPRVGDAAFAATFDDLPRGAYVRVQHRSDPIPSEPPTSIGYAHVPAAVFVLHDAHGRMLVDVDPDDPRVPSLPQDLGLQESIAGAKQIDRMADHHEVNYAILHARLAGVEVR